MAYNGRLPQFTIIVAQAARRFATVPTCQPSQYPKVRTTASLNNPLAEIESTANAPAGEGCGLSLAKGPN
eukprot:1903012-Alexandrium_andersonii.AAC.1